MEFKTLDATVVDYINGLQNQIDKYKNDAVEYHNKYLEIKERLDLLLYKRFGRSAEQILIDEKQRLLFEQETENPDEDEKSDAGELQTIKSFTRKKPGRKPLDPNLPREEIIIDISEEEKNCACGAQLTRIGEETSEKLHIIPPRIYVEKTIRPKYACRKCEGTEDEENKTVRIAPVPPSIIPRSIVSPSLLSTIIIQKFQDHLPYYRQERQFEYIGVTISRQDMSNWVRHEAV
jgi:transposase